MKASSSRSLTVAVALVFTGTAGCNAPARTTSSDGAVAPPNVILIVADDLGWNDVGYHGSEIRTPHIDSLAGEGVRLERFYVTPICSPTRSGLLTGRAPIRYGRMSAVIPQELMSARRVDRSLRQPTHRSFINAAANGP